MYIENFHSPPHTVPTLLQLRDVANITSALQVMAAQAAMRSTKSFSPWTPMSVPSTVVFVLAVMLGLGNLSYEYYPFLKSGLPFLKNTGNSLEVVTENLGTVLRQSKLGNIVTLIYLYNPFLPKGAWRTLQMMRITFQPPWYWIQRMWVRISVQQCIGTIGNNILGQKGMHILSKWN